RRAPPPALVRLPRTWPAGRHGPRRGLAGQYEVAETGLSYDPSPGRARQSRADRAMASVIVSKVSGMVVSSLGAGRTAPCRLLVPEHGQGRLDLPCARLGLLRALDGAHVLPLAAVGQVVVGGAGSRIGVQGAGEVRGLGNNAGRGIDVDLDL